MWMFFLAGLVNVLLALPILAVASHADEPVTDLNSQIERFNKERPGAMGIAPIERRVARVEWANKEEIAHCFDEKGAEFLTLKREADGRFRGVIEVPFHEPADRDPHSWGHVLAEFFLPKDACKRTEPTARTETLEGIVIEKRANVKSYEAWNSPSDPYYVLDRGDVTETHRDGERTRQQVRKRHVTLRPSATVSTADLAGLKGKRVALRGHHTEGEPYMPADHAEQVPMEPVLKTKLDGSTEVAGSRAANRGAGFVVEAIMVGDKPSPPGSEQKPQPRNNTAPAPPAPQQAPRLDEAELRVLAIKALDLEKQGQYRAALDLLEKLGDDDFTIPRHREIKRELDDGRFEVEYVGPFHVGNRRLAMMRCHLQLGNPREAVTLAWQTLEAGTSDASACACIAEHPDLQGGFDAVEGRLRDLRKKDPKDAVAAQCFEYVGVQRELAAGKYAALVERIRSGAWDRASERGPNAELKEYVANTLAKRTKEALPELIKVLAQYDQSTWIVYCLGRSGDQRAIEPLLKYLQSVKNYYARQETLGALYRLGPPRDSAVLTKTLQPLLAGEDQSDRHDALILIRDHWGRPELAPLVIDALDKMLQRPATNWGQAASRIVACEVLGKYADERAVPVLLKAMEDSFEHHFFDHGPGRHMGHSYRTIWWEADAALRKIAHASPIEPPATNVGPKSGQREKMLAAWKRWFEGRPSPAPTR